MIEETEDDRLDQSLRDTFSDFTLPPARHVWSGIEGQMMGLPRAPRPVPLLLVLPLVGLVGVGVGWLLPRPAPLQRAPRSSAAPTNARLARQLPELLLPTSAAYSIPRSSTVALAFGSSPARAAAAATIAQPVGRPAGVAGPARLQKPGNPARPQANRPVAATVSATIPADFPADIISPVTEPVALGSETGPGSTSQAVARPGWSGLDSMATPAATAPASSVFTPSLPVPASKGDASRERRPEYRVPTHRLAERGRGMRRIQNSLTRHWQHLFGPRRARVAAQPDF